MKWRTEKMCEDCPFAKSGAGLQLRLTLRPGRWGEILRALRNDGHFLCHKTTDDTGNGANLHCAGSIEWQLKKNGYPSQLARIMQRISKVRATNFVDKAVS